MKPPRPVILDNGDVLAPAEKFDGTYEIERVPVGAPKHATGVAQAQGVKQPIIGAGIGVLIGVLLPIVGLVISVVLACSWTHRGRRCRTRRNGRGRRTQPRLFAR